MMHWAWTGTFAAFRFAPSRGHSVVEILVVGFLVALIGLLFVSYYLVLPLIAGRKHRMAVNPAVGYASRQFDVDAPSNVVPPEHITVFFEMIEEEIHPLYFQPVAWLHFPQMVPNTDTYVAVFERPQSKDYAAALACVTRMPQISERRSYVLEFQSVSPDETIWNTNNSIALPGFPRLPKKTIFRFPGLADARILYEMHVQLSRKHGAGAERRRCGPDWAMEAGSGIEDEYQKLLACGLYQLDETGDYYRFRLKAIPYCVMGLLWPFNRIRRWLLFRNARRLLAHEGHDPNYPTVDYAERIAQRIASSRTAPPTKPDF